MIRSRIAILSGDTHGFDREWMAGLFLLALGVGTRLVFATLYPTIPFWDFLQMVHFGVVLRDHGPFAPGWYWGQFNPGLPVCCPSSSGSFPAIRSPRPGRRRRSPPGSFR